eukprot:COSAG02_NODE_4131_length_5739_cov_5.860993_3_plen_105_part_00
MLLPNLETMIDAESVPMATAEAVPTTPPTSALDAGAGVTAAAVDAARTARLAQLSGHDVVAGTNRRNSSPAALGDRSAAVLDLDDFLPLSENDLACLPAQDEEA